MAHHATKQIFRLLSFCCCVERETLRASHVQAEATQYCAAAEERTFLSAWGYTQRHTLTCSLSPLLHNSVCQVQLVNRSQIRPTSCFQHMGSWRRGSCRAALQMCDMQVWSCLEINRWFQVGKEMEKSCTVFSKRERECNLLSPAGFCSFWEGRQKCRWWELQAYLVGYLVQLLLDVGCTAQGGDIGVSESSLSMFNWGRWNTKSIGKNIKLHQKSAVYVLKYVTDGFRILHPLLLSMQFFLLLPDNSNFGTVQHHQRRDEVYDLLFFTQPIPSSS